jgi:hypothetical protein
MLSTLINEVNQKQGVAINKIRSLINQLVDEGTLIEKKGEVGKKGGRKHTILHRARGKGGLYRDENGKSAFKPDPMAEPHWIESEVEADRPSNNLIQVEGNLLAALANGGRQN